MSIRRMRHRRRPGTTLIELLIFMAVLAAVGTAIFPLLFTATEDRLLQQTVALVEQNGIQILQAVTTRVQQSERILYPSLARTGSVLALQSGSGAINPVIFGLSGGTLVFAERANKQDLSSSQVAVTDLHFRNTSVSATRQSVEVTFTVSRSIRLQAPHSYGKFFQATISLFPDDVPAASPCSCAMPGCSSSGTFVWNVCDTTTSACLETETPMSCP